MAASSRDRMLARKCEPSLGRWSNSAARKKTTEAIGDRTDIYRNRPLKTKNPAEAGLVGIWYGTLGVTERPMIFLPDRLQVRKRLLAKDLCCAVR
jgi:hypothetical protein